MRYEVKGFVKPHPDYEYDCCEDRFAINMSSRRFAVADGMTESYLSDYFADLLVNRYVSYKEGELIVPASFFINEEFGKEWMKHTKEKEKEVKGTIYEKRLKRKKDLCRYAASTFAGMSIHNDTIDYTVIGDCCIFGLDNNFNLQFVYPNVIETGFNNAPPCITSDGIIKGECINGCMPLYSGYIYLLTDAIAKWFLERLNDSKNSGKRLWDLSSHVEMVNFLNDEYESNRLRADDVAIIAIHLIDDELKQEDVILYSDNFDELLQKSNIQVTETSTDNLASVPVIEISDDLSGAHDNFDDAYCSRQMQDNNDVNNAESDMIYPQIMDSPHQEYMDYNKEHNNTIFDKKGSTLSEEIPTPVNITTNLIEPQTEGGEDSEETINCHSSITEFSKDDINSSEEVNQGECMYTNQNQWEGGQSYQDVTDKTKKSIFVENAYFKSCEGKNNFWKDMWGELRACKDLWQEIKKICF